MIPWTITQALVRLMDTLTRYIELRIEKERL